VFARQPDKPAPDTPKTAEQQFKNIQALKGVPAEQLIPTMQFISASLGVECDFCHVDRQMDKDDKKEKQTARKMIAMELAINRANFDGKVQVTCNTCHRGSAHPVGTPVLSADSSAPHSHDDSTESHANLPSAEQILDKYLAAVGGADALKKIKTRKEKGTMEVDGQQFPIDLYCEAPDKRVSVSHMQSGPSVTAFNGEVGWLTMQRGVHRMSAPERQAARIDAEMYFPVRVREMYQEFHVLPGEPVEGHATVDVAASGADVPPLRLSFDQASGLLLVLVRYTETPLGRLPTQIGYGDYRETDGVKIPYRWTLARPNGRFTIRVDEVQQNAPIDESLFVAPAESEAKSQP
ncbi:MAG TPA: c-type cytochrome, partial [Dongiaceae bacterium]|nr:c-type cytochrome [Dongiaceae bacterium]